MCSLQHDLLQDVLLAMMLPDDPRHYARVASSNLLLAQISLMSGEKDATQRLSQAEALRVQLKQALSHGQDDEIEEAFALSRTPEAFRFLWEARRAVLETPQAETHALVFAFPVVMVAGIQGSAQLPARLPNVSAIQALLVETGVFANSRDVCLFSPLMTQKDLQSLQASQLFQWAPILQDAPRGLPVSLQGTPATIQGEAVVLRYLVGLAILRTDQPVPIQLGGGVEKWGMALSKALGEQLAVPDMTLFPLPRPPYSLFQAIYHGNQARLEVAMQVFVSTQLRKIRLLGHEPVATLATHDNQSLRLSLSAKELAECWEGFEWPLHPLDSLPRIVQSIEALLKECQVPTLEVVELVQPAEDIDTKRPFFVTAHHKATILP